MLSGFGAMRDRWGAAVALVALIVVAAETVLVLATPTVTYSSTQFVIDLWFTLDSMWRAVGGQVPNVDFHGPIGPTFYAVYALAGLASPFSILLMLRADLLVGLVAALLTVAILWRRAPVEAIAVLALLAFGAAVTGHEMGSSPFDRFYSFLAPYNRWGWALVIPAAAGALIPARRSWMGAALVGVIGTLLLFLKLSYFAAFVGFCVVGYGLDWAEGRGRIAGVAAFALPALLTLVLALAAPAIVHGYFTDIAQAASINALRIGKMALSAPEAALFLGAGLLVLHLAGGLRGARDWTAALRVAAAVGGGAVILLQNHDTSEAPMYPAALAIAYAVARHRTADRARADGASHTGSSFAAFAAVAIMAAPILFASLFSPVFQYVAERSGELHAFAELRGTPLAGLRLKDLTLADNGKADVILIDDARLPSLGCAQIACTAMQRTVDGVVALRRLGLPRGTRVFALDFSNPFPAIVGSPDPRFGYSWYDYGRSWTQAFGPAPDRLFAEADVVMEPLFNGPYDQMRRVYGPALPRFYRLAATTPYWRVWVKPALAARS